MIIAKYSVPTSATVISDEMVAITQQVTTVATSVAQAVAQRTVDSMAGEVTV